MISEIAMLSTIRTTHRFAAVLTLVTIAPGVTVYAAPPSNYVGSAAGLEAAADSDGATGSDGITGGMGQDGAVITDPSGGFATITVSGESTGGNGGNGGSGSFVDGGTGGISVSFTGNTNSLDNFGTITGGNGGNGGSGTFSSGGSGGTGVSFAGNSNSLDNFGSITGGNGGNGGSGSHDYGGAGGIGVRFSADTSSLVNSASITGGNGGNGTSTGSITDGGSGGIGVIFSADNNSLVNSASITGGNGGNGGSGTNANGGNGAIATSFTGNNNSLENSGSITGGNGGNGGPGTAAFGGSGGIAASFTGDTNSLNNSGSIIGGNGGLGGSGSAAFGGSGAIAASFTGDTNSLNNSGSIIGGNGGIGGSGFSDFGGSGGIAASFTGNNNSLKNTASITGGNGGNGGSGPTAFGGSGGIGVKFSGENNILTNSGTISGGFASDGVQRADAVVFEGMNNRLVIENGAVFVGKVKAIGSSGDTLAFGGNENQSFDSSTIADSTPAGEQFEGFESVEINSGAKVTLTGTSTYTQDTIVKRGHLDVAGDLSSTTIRLEVDGTLNGIGTIGTVVFAVGSVHAPGNSIGSQTINGTYSLANGILEIEVTPGVANDEVIVNGSVDLNQGKLKILGLNEVSTGSDTASHVIILNDGTDAVVGVFDSVDNRLAFYKVEVRYNGGDGNDVVLELERNATAIEDIAITSNQLAVARVFDTQPGSSDFQTVLGAIIAGTDDNARGALDMLAGDIHATAPHIHRLLHERTWTTLSNRLSRRGTPGAPLSTLITGTEVQVGAYVPDGKSPIINDEAPRVWVEAIAGRGNLDADGRIGSAKTDFEWGGGIVGYEIGGTGPLTLGTYFQYTEVDIDQANRLAGIDSTQAATGIYAGYQLPDDWKLSAHLGASWMDNDSRRQLQFGGLNRTAIGEYDDFHLSTTLEVAKTLDLGETGYLEPFASMTGRREHDGSFTESGAGAANLLRGSDTDYFANSLLGVRFGGEWESQNGAWNLRPRAQMGWQHRYGSVDNDYQAQFQGAPVAFTSSGTDTARDTFVGTVGMEFLSLENGMRLYADYGFGLSSKHDEHTFGAGVSIPW